MSQQEQLRRSYLTLPLPDSPAAAAGLATFIATHPMRILSAQLSVSGVGTGTGGTTAVVKQNTVALVTSAPLTLTVAGGVKVVKADITGTSQSYPGGQRVDKGDIITVDLTAVPGTTPPAGVNVILSITQLDV